MKKCFMLSMLISVVGLFLLGVGCKRASSEMNTTTPSLSSQSSQSPDLCLSEDDVSSFADFSDATFQVDSVTSTLTVKTVLGNEKSFPFTLNESQQMCFQGIKLSELFNFDDNLKKSLDK
ncbi:MAG: hypothetical protein OXC40_02270 [Proteobacteria bacterium]|nr:hypothetical protein [Pseudomonadota bacterium]